MKWYFDFTEFITLEDNEFGKQIFAPDNDVIDKIVKYYLVPLQFVRMELGMPVYILSCYRTQTWEEKKGRDGSSQHCFQGEGACDVTAKDLMRLFLSLKMGDNFSRIAYYPKQRFFHIDRKSNERQYFIADPNWEYCTEQDIIEILR